MPANPKIKREIDEDYLKYIRSQSCIISGQIAEPHHTRTRGASGSDYCAVPLSRILHTEIHAIGRYAFREKYGVDFNKAIIRLLIGYIKQLKARE